jgi:hypothetical protein
MSTPSAPAEGANARPLKCSWARDSDKQHQRHGERPMSEKHLDVGHVVVFGYEDNRLIREAARAAGVGAIEFIRRSALAAAAPRPAEETR